MSPTRIPRGRTSQRTTDSLARRQGTPRRGEMTDLRPATWSRPARLSQRLPFLRCSRTRCGLVPAVLPFHRSEHIHPHPLRASTFPAMTPFADVALLLCACEGVPFFPPRFLRRVARPLWVLMQL